jgi:glycosyltransferase involved in cell wall biosynthesis
MSAASPFTVLHYTGYDDDQGGIVSVIRALAATGRDECILGLNQNGRQHREPPLPVVELPRLAGEKIGPLNFWRARAVARAARDWLAADARRIFHGHSRAGLLVALWLHFMGETRVVASVHCYGRQRWFYRWAARRLGARLFWLSPAMRSYYGGPGREWEQCIPGGVPASRVSPAAPVAAGLRLGGVGALVRWKGWHHVIEALALLPSGSRPRVTFTHIGAGDAGYLSEMRERAARLGVAAQVVFRGAEPSADALLGEIDALVIAAGNEPCSMAMLEALAAGVPVLAADTGGARDVIREGVNGALYRTGDPTALAAQLYRWLVQPLAWDREKIRATTIDIDRVAGQWAEVYAAL